MILKSLKHIGLGLLVVFSVSVTLAHHQEKHPDAGAVELEQMVQEADLIITGVVTNIEYKLSEVNDAKEQLPFTFLTINVRDVLKGKADNQSIVLRFLGGHAGDGRYLSVEGQPTFATDNQLILFIKGNTIMDCPVVGCGEGRFRIADGRVFNEHGQILVRGEKGIGLGPNTLAFEARRQELGTGSPISEKTQSEILQFIREKYPRFATALQSGQQIPEAQQREVFNALLEAFPELKALPRTERLNPNVRAPSSLTPLDEPKEESDDKSDEPSQQAQERLQPLSVADFVQLIKQAVDKNPRVAGEFRSANINQPIQLSTLPMMKAPNFDRSSINLNEEEKRLQQNGGNPVLR